MILTVYKGRHRCRPLRILNPWMNVYEWDFKFRFKNNCWYPRDAIDVYGVSKLWGIAMPVHAERPFGKIPLIKKLINSIIVGWRPDFDKEGLIRMHRITDSNGIEARPYMTTVETGKEYTGKLILEQGYATLRLADRIVRFPIYSNMRFGYEIAFFFGGRSVAPWDMSASWEIVNKKRIIQWLPFM